MGRARKQEVAEIRRAERVEQQRQRRYKTALDLLERLVAHHNVETQQAYEDHHIEITWTEELEEIMYEAEALVGEVKSP